MMQPSKKYYFMREERVAILANDEETARLELAQLYETSEDFVLTDVKDGIILDGQWRAV